MDSRPSPAVSEPVETASSLAEDLPELYRTILARVAELERVGARREGGRVRAEATRAYSEAWDEAARRDLAGLLARADRALADEERPRPRRLRWWSAPAR
jgi:hypothetical protein